LARNKLASIQRWINDNQLSFAALMKTWHNGADSPNFTASALQDFRSVERARLCDSSASLGTNYDGVFLLFDM
jgi:hypothetical protein